MGEYNILARISLYVQMVRLSETVMLSSRDSTYNISRVWYLIKARLISFLNTQQAGRRGSPRTGIGRGTCLVLAIKFLQPCAQNIVWMSFRVDFLVHSFLNLTRGNND